MVPEFASINFLCCTLKLYRQEIPPVDFVRKFGICVEIMLNFVVSLVIDPIIFFWGKLRGWILGT